MKTRRVKASSLPMAMTNLMLASSETIARRILISKNKCSQAEYRRMVSEKAQAAMLSGFKLVSSNGRASITSLMLRPEYRIEQVRPLQEQWNESISHCAWIGFTVIRAYATPEQLQ